MQVLTSTSILTAIKRPANPIDFYEAAIATDETIVNNYWHLGIAYLLAGREEDAQAAWFVPLSTAAASEIDNLTEDLLGVLEREATYHTELPELEQAWLLRQHICTLAPDRVENIFRQPLFDLDRP